MFVHFQQVFHVTVDAPPGGQISAPMRWSISVKPKQKSG